MKFLLTAFLILFCVSLFADEEWRSPDFIPAEITGKKVELSDEAKAEAKALADFAMSRYLPSDISEKPIQEQVKYLDECAEKIHGILKLYPESETALNALLRIRKLPEFRQKAIEELGSLREKAPESRFVQSAYLSTLLMAGKIDEASAELPKLLEKFPRDPLIIVQAATVYAEKNDFDALENVLALMEEIPELQKDPAMRILYLRHLLEIDDQETAGEYVDALTDDEEFIAQPELVNDLAWNNLAKVDGWSALTGIMGTVFLHNFWSINDDLRCELCRKTIFAALRCGDHQSISLILKFISELEDRALRFRLASNLGDPLNQLTTELLKNKPEAIDTPLILLNQAIGELCLGNLPTGAAPDIACRTLVKYYLLGGNAARALELLRMIQKPTQDDYAKMTELLVHEGLFEEALPRLRKILAENPDTLTAEFYMMLGMTEDKCGHPEESTKAFYKALEINPNYASAANYLGYTLLITDGDLTEAERLLTIAHREDPTNAAILDSVAWLRFKQGRNAEALRLMAEAVELIGPHNLSEESNAEIREHLQAILLSLGHAYLASFYN